MREPFVFDLSAPFKCIAGLNAGDDFHAPDESKELVALRLLGHIKPIGGRNFTVINVPWQNKRQAKETPL